jgi:hypothetical protein
MAAEAREDMTFRDRLILTGCGIALVLLLLLAR